MGDTSLILIVTPSKYFHSTLVKVLELAPDGSDLVIATKGFIPETGLLPCQTAYQEMERLGKKMKVSVLSGANLAHEIVYGGAGVTQIACEDDESFKRLKPLIETSRFSRRLLGRCYRHDNIRGLEECVRHWVRDTGRLETGP